MIRAIVGDACARRQHRWAHPRSGGAACHCGAYRLCNQCWRGKPVAAFGGRLKNCLSCGGKYRPGTYGSRASTPRRGLTSHGAPRYVWTNRSGNRKLGPIPTCLASPESCPPSCGFYGKGCFAEFGVLGMHWRRTARDGVSFEELLERVRLLPEGQLWRYATAGDLPGTGDTLDLVKLCELATANIGRRGFTFTHKPVEDPGVQEIVRAVNEEGFTVNLSADSLERADDLAELRIAPVAVVLPVWAQRATCARPMGAGW